MATCAVLLLLPQPENACGVTLTPRYIGGWARMARVSGSGSRYERSMPGMIGAMLVVVGVILVFVVVRAMNRDDLAVEREPIDYLPTVQEIQTAGGFPAVYPPSLPEGWKAVDLSYDPARLWSLSMFNDDDRFVGLFQGRSPVDDLVEEYVDEDAEEGEPVRLDSDLAPEWRTFTDEGGDTALVAEVRQTAVLVVSSSSQEELEDLVTSLSQKPID